MFAWNKPIRQTENPRDIGPYQVYINKDTHRNHHHAKINENSFSFVLRGTPMNDESDPRNPSPLSAIHVILTNPESPGNVGAVARIITNFGLGELRIVGDPIHHEEDARIMAHRSLDVLENAVVYPSLRTSLEKCHFVAAFSARGRKETPVHPVRQAVRELLSHAAAHPVAVVFGPESDGLSASDLAQCDMIVHIPQHRPGPALNLAQAVAIFGSEVFQATGVPGSVASTPRAMSSDIERAARRTVRLARHCGLSVRNRPEETYEALRNALARNAATPGDIAVVEKWLSHIEWFTGVSGTPLDRQDSE
jgi:TrmH family RNA methyltransferase